MRISSCCGGDDGNPCCNHPFTNSQLAANLINKSPALIFQSAERAHQRPPPPPGQGIDDYNHLSAAERSDASSFYA